MVAPLAALRSTLRYRCSSRARSRKRLPFLRQVMQRTADVAGAVETIMMNHLQGQIRFVGGRESGERLPAVAERPLAADLFDGEQLGIAGGSAHAERHGARGL